MNSVKIFCLAILLLLLPIVLTAAPSPWDSWRSGYTNFEHGEMLREKGSYTQALKFFERARKNYLAVRSARPDWNQRVIADRLRDCDRQISELRRLLNENKPSSSSPSVSGTTAGKKTVAPGTSIRPSSSNTYTSPAENVAVSGSTASVNEAEVTKLKQQIIELKLRNERMNRELQTQRKFENEIASLLRDRKIAGDKYALLEKRYHSLEAELKKPGDRIAALEQQLLNERLSAGRLEKQLTSAEQQLKIEKESSRMSQAAKRSLENLLKQRNEELLRSSQEIAAISRRLKESGSLQEKISGLNTQISNLQNRISDLDKEKDELNRVNQQLTEKNRSLSDKNSELSGKSGEINSEKQQLSGKIRQLTDENRQLSGKNRELLKVNQDLEKEKQKIFSENKGLLEEKQQLTNDNRKLNEKHEKVVAEQRELNRKNTLLAEKNTSLTDQLKVREQEIAELRKNSRELIHSSSKSITDKDRELAGLKDQVLILKRDLSTRESESLSRQRQVENLSRQLSGLERSLADKDRQLSSRNSRLTGQEKELRECNALLADREKSLNDLKKELESLTSRLDDFNKTITGQREELKEQSGKLTAKDKQLVSLQENLAARNQLVETLEQKVASLNTRLTGIDKMAQTSAGQAEELRKERDNIGNELMTVRQKINLLTAENRNLQLNLEQEKNNAKLNAAAVAGLRERNRALEDDVKVLYQRNSDLEKRLTTRNSEDFKAAATARNSVKKLENDLISAQNELVSLRKEADNKKSQQQELERKLKAVNDENLKARAEVVAAAEKEKELQKELALLRPVKGQFEQLQRDFKALAAENRENRLLVEAAKPRQAELEKAKLRLVENDRLKSELMREQQLNAELKESYNQEHQELVSLRKRAAEFDSVRRKLAEFEARAKEAERLQNVEKELALLRERETELASLKIKFNEQETRLRNVQAALNNGENERKKIAGELFTLQQKNQELQKYRRTNNELEAIVVSQNTELDKLNRQLAAAASREKVDLHAACRIEADKLRAVAATAGPLNDQIRRLQSEVQNLKKGYDQLSMREGQVQNTVKLRDAEILRLRKLNQELAEIRKKSAEDLLEKVDASRISRLEDELSSLNKLNAELAAERDKLAAQLENRDDGSDRTVAAPLQSDRSPEDLAGAGFVAEKDGKSELAVWHYRQALANNPDFVPAHLRLGMLFYRRGSFADAVNHLKSALDADPENRQLAIDTARCYIALSRFGNAKSIVDRLLKENPENALILMCSALIDAGCGEPAKAEGKLLTAARLAPQSPEIRLELARLLSQSISDRRSEAVIAYEKARSLGAKPEPALEKELGTMLDDRRELVSFMSGAAREAEIGGDWLSAVWYYKKIVAEKHPGFIPLLAFAQWKSGNSAAAKETLEFNTPSRNAMVIRFLIAAAEKDDEIAMRSAQQSAGAVIPVDWVGVNLELEKIRQREKLSAAEKILLQSLQKKSGQ